MKASELFSLLQKKCKGEDPEVDFLVYRWDDDLEAQSYHPAWFEKIRLKGGRLQILTET